MKYIFLDWNTPIVEHHTRLFTRVPKLNADVIPALKTIMENGNKLVMYVVDERNLLNAQRTMFSVLGFKTDEIEWIWEAPIELGPDEIYAQKVNTITRYQKEKHISPDDIIVLAPHGDISFIYPLLSNGMNVAIVPNLCWSLNLKEAEEHRTVFFAGLQLKTKKNRGMINHPIGNRVFAGIIVGTILFSLFLLGSLAAMASGFAPAFLLAGITAVHVAYGMPGVTLAGIVSGAAIIGFSGLVGGIYGYLRDKHTSSKIKVLEGAQPAPTVPLPRVSSDMQLHKAGLNLEKRRVSLQESKRLSKPAPEEPVQRSLAVQELTREVSSTRRRSLR